MSAAGISLLAAATLFAEDCGCFSVKMVSKGVDTRAIQMQFLGSTPHPAVEQLFETDADGESIRIHKTVYRGIYDGIDLVSYREKGKALYDLIIAPGRDPSVIRICYDGFENVELTARLPAYQEVNGNRTLIPVTMQKTDRISYSLAIGRYDPSLSLIIPTTSVPVYAKAQNLACQD